MGKAESSAGTVDSDYSGRSLGRITAAEVAAADPDEVPDTWEVVTLEDGRKAFLEGDDAYLMGPDGLPDYDRPVDVP